jgi:hypothetical protein
MIRMFQNYVARDSKNLGEYVSPCGKNRTTLLSSRRQKPSLTNMLTSTAMEWTAAMALMMNLLTCWDTSRGIGRELKAYVKNIKFIDILCSVNCILICSEIDRLCDLVVRVLGYRSGGPGSIPGTTRKKK